MTPWWLDCARCRELKQSATDLSEMIRYATGDAFPAPNDDASRLEWLRAQIAGQNMREVIQRANDRERGAQCKPASADPADIRK